MKELQSANHILGDPEALHRRWNETGYWFFQGALDKAAVGSLRDKYMAELRSSGVVDPESEEPIWNRASLSGMGDGLNVAKVPALRAQRAWETFVQHPKINDFFESLIGAPLEWLTSSDFYRIVPPASSLSGDPFSGRHQDGLGLPGLDFITCWIPLADIDAACGGLALSEGSLRNGIFADRWFDKNLVAEDSWARADYRLGDVVMFMPSMLHSGLPNSSNRFRLSLDIRVLRPSSARPIYGTVLAVDSDSILIRDEKAGDIPLKINAATHLRGIVPESDIPILIKQEELAHYLPPGSEVMATSENDVALVVRPNEYQRGIAEHE